MREHNPLGQQIGNYCIIAPIASGAFGTVYQAQHQILQERIVAIKILHVHLNSEQERQQFLREAHVLEQLRHPHILALLDVGVTDYFPYLITAYAQQGSLRKLLRERSGQHWPWEMVLPILAQIGAALHYAHQQQVIHRDLKPENILFPSAQEAVLADFGIATILSTSTMTSTTITGTPSYMAPEQFRGNVSLESDQYALGCLAYELLTGRPPFSGPDAFSLGFKHITEPPLPPRQLNQQIAPYVEQAILKALAKERHERHSNVAAFITALSPPTVYQMTSADTVLPTSHAQATPADLQAAQQWREKGDSLLFDQHHYEEALAAYGQAIHLDPNNALTYRNKGVALYNLKHYQEAIIAYDQAIRLNPDDFIAYNNKGFTLQNIERYQEAIVAYDQAIRLNSNSAGAYYNKGAVLENLEHYQEAIAAYDQAISLDLNFAGAYHRKGVVLNDIGQYQEAIVTCDQAIHLDSSNVVTYYNKGVALHNLKRYQEALEVYEQILRLDPGNHLALKGKQKVLSQLRYSPATTQEQQKPTKQWKEETTTFIAQKRPEHEGTEQDALPLTQPVLQKHMFSLTQPGDILPDAHQLPSENDQDDQAYQYLRQQMQSWPYIQGPNSTALLVRVQERQIGKVVYLLEENDWRQGRKEDMCMSYVKTYRVEDRSLAAAQFLRGVDGVKLKADTSYAVWIGMEHPRFITLQKGKAGLVDLR